MFKCHAWSRAIANTLYLEVEFIVVYWTESFVLEFRHGLFEALFEAILNDMMFELGFNLLNMDVQTLGTYFVVLRILLY